MQTVTVQVNGRERRVEVDERALLLDLLRDDLGLTGTHNGCLEARCGCCAVLLDGESVKSCNLLALQADGHEVTTVEGLASAAPDSGPFGSAISYEAMTALQRAFHEQGAVQCGFCTPGMLMVLTDYLNEHSDPSREDVRLAIRGNLCRCTGYQKIVDAAMTAAAELRSAAFAG